MTRGGRSLTAEERLALEGRHTARRIVELELDPVRGKFDAAHLREVNRRIFQDLPGLGFDDVHPGEFRRPVPGGKDWVKARSLGSVNAASNVAYSPMDKASRDRLDRALERAHPDRFRGLKTAEFTEQFASLYVELDYIHPFGDGNSRTLRTFTRQLARDAGYEVSWDRFNRGEVGRDLLYIARDRSVNALAVPHIRDAGTKRHVQFTLDQFEGNPDLRTALRDAIRPLRAMSFERLPKDEALRSHPELGTAYETLRAAETYFANKLPADSTAQRNALALVAKHIQTQLNAGEVKDLALPKQERSIAVEFKLTGREIDR